MSVMVNPFLGNGYSLAEMTQAMSILPNRYGRIGEMGLFTPEPISQRNVIIESVEGELRLLPATKPGAPATVGSNDMRSMRAFVVPHIPHNDVLLPEEVQGIRGFGLSANEDPMASIMARKLMKMRAKHAQTLEYMRANALKGITKDGAGNTIYDWHAEFGIEKTSVDFDFANTTQKG
ncbi:MAG: major capsid protein, partial [Gammaproteobacteria bacterium]|nr:major capsid protein [Gammaproteobacteria bacterium]